MGWLSAAIGVVGGLFGNSQEREAAAEANQQSWDQMLWQNSFNRGQARVAYKRGRKNMRLADRMSDKNVRLAQKFQGKQAKLAWERTDEAALRNRKWAKADYRQQKKDMGSQFVRLRHAAEKAGFNPLSVLGASMVPNPAGGISSSSYGAASGVAPIGVSAPGVSAAMGGYGAPVAVPALASNDAILGGIQELGRELTGEAALERENAKFANELARIELEQAKARLAAPAVPTTFGMGLGRQAVPVDPMRVGEQPRLVGGFGSPPSVDTGRLNWPSEVVKEEIETGFRTVVDPNTGHQYRIPKSADDMDGFLMEAIVKATQDKARQWKDFKSEAGAWWKNASERWVNPPLTTAPDIQDFPTDWETRWNSN